MLSVAYPVGVVYTTPVWTALRSFLTLDIAMLAAAIWARIFSTICGKLEDVALSPPEIWSGRCWASLILLLRVLSICVWASMALEFSVCILR